MGERRGRCGSVRWALWRLSATAAVFPVLVGCAAVNGPSAELAQAPPEESGAVNGDGVASGEQVEEGVVADSVDGAGDDSGDGGDVDDSSDIDGVDTATADRPGDGGELPESTTTSLCDIDLDAVPGADATTVDRDTPVTIPDDRLRSAVLSNLDLAPDSLLYPQDMERLEDVRLPSASLYSLEGLQHAINLKALFVGYNHISDIQVVESLRQLELLWINTNPIEDLSPLANLSQLRELHVQGLDQSDLTVLTQLNNLSTLIVGFYPHIDLKSISTLPNLFELVMTATEVSDISELSSLKCLRYLSAVGTLIQDLSPLVGMTNLLQLDLRDNLITDLSPLLEKKWPEGYPVGIDLRGNPLSEAAVQSQIPALQAQGIEVWFDEVLFTAESEPQIYNDSVYVVPSSVALTEPDTDAQIAASLQATREFYKVFRDEFDFIVLLYNLEVHEMLPGFLGRHMPSLNAVEGVGLTRRDDTRAWGSDGKLQAVLGIARRAGIEDGPILHELMHTWAAYTVPDADVHWGHWGFTSADGQLGGFNVDELIDLGDGRYTAGERISPEGYATNTVPYSPIELYFAGLIGPDEVPDLVVAADDASWVFTDDGFAVTTDEGDPIFQTSGFRTISIEDIVQEHGARVPSHIDSQKAFRAAVILLIDEAHPAIREHLDAVSRAASWFSHPGNDDDPDTYNFYEATGGRATIAMGDLSQFSKN